MTKILHVLFDLKSLVSTKIAIWQIFRFFDKTFDPFNQYQIPFCLGKFDLELFLPEEYPMAPPKVRGIINLRGAAIPVLDLGLCFGDAQTLANPRTCIVMLEVHGSGGTGLVGIIVDAVSEVLEIPAEQIEPAPSLQGRLSPEFVVGIGKLSDRFVLLLDIEHMLGSDDWPALFASNINTDGLQA